VKVLGHHDVTMYQIFALIAILEDFRFQGLSPLARDEKCATLPSVRRDEVGSNRASRDASVLPLLQALKRQFGAAPFTAGLKARPFMRVHTPKPFHWAGPSSFFWATLFISIPTRFATGRAGLQPLASAPP